MQNNSETKMKIIDSHTHYVHPRFDFGRETVLSELEKEGIVAVIEAAIGFRKAWVCQENAILPYHSPIS